MLQMVPQIFKTLVSEGQQIFAAKEEFDKKQNQLTQLVKEVSSSLDQVEEFQAKSNRELYSKDQQQIISQCKDFLHQSDLLLKSLPQNLTVVNGYFYSKTNNYKEMTTCIEELKLMKQQISAIEHQTMDIFDTVILPQYRVEVQQQVVHEIEIILKLKAPKQIKDIFDQYPRHLTTQYRFKVHLDETDIHKYVHSFKRHDFNYLSRVDRTIKIYTISREKHCTLEIRRNHKFQPHLKETFIPDAQFVQSEIYWGSELEETTIETTKPQNEFRLYIVANGKGGVVIQRHMSEKHHIRYEQSCELQEKDQIILLQEDYEPQISFIVQHFVIKQL